MTLPIVLMFITPVSCAHLLSGTMWFLTMWWLFTNTVAYYLAGLSVDYANLKSILVMAD